MIGTSEGRVVLFETKFHTEVFQLQTHQATILCTLVRDNQLYVSGVDSKVVLLKQHFNTFVKVEEFRNQSHDTYALEELDGRVLSAGVNTDICFQGETVFRVEAELDLAGNAQMVAINEHDAIKLLNRDGDVIVTMQPKHNVCALILSNEYICYSHFETSYLFQIVYKHDVFKTIK